MRPRISGLAIPFFAIFALLLATAASAQKDESEAENLNRHFMALFSAHKYEQAEKSALNAVEVLEAKRGQSHPDVARMLDNLASVYQAQGKFAEVIPLLERALSIRENALGKEHLDVALTLNIIAWLKIIYGHYQQAEPLLQRALGITEKIFGPDHPSDAMSLNNIAVLHHRLGQYQKVEPLIQRTIAIRKKIFPADHPDLAASWNNLAALYDVQGRYAEAETLYQRALIILEKATGKENPSLVAVLNNLSRLNIILSNFSAAEFFIHRSLAILQKDYGEDHSAVALVLNRLGELRLFQGNYEEAEAAFTRSLAILEKTFGPNQSDQPDTAGVIGHLIGLYKVTGREQEAAKLAGRAGNKENLPESLGDKMAPPWLKLSEDSWLPLEAVVQAPAIYPEILRRSGTKGMVMVNVLITEEGMVQEPIIRESAHPALEKAVVEAVLKFRYKPPLTISGKKISGRLTIPMNFVLDEVDGGDLAFKLPKNTDSLPPEFQYDVPPIIKVVAPVVYPVDLLRKNIEGSAKVSVVINPKGEVREVKILEATHPEFGAATRATMQSWLFDPALKGGKPTWAIFTKTQKFNRDDREVNLNSATEELLRKNEDGPEIHPLSGLDALPQPLYAPTPAYPSHLKGSGITDRVLVEFFIDKEGWVHLPRLMEAKNEELGWLALTAVSRWRYTPPLKAGKAVLTRARMPLRFEVE